MKKNDLLLIGGLLILALCAYVGFGAYQKTQTRDAVAVVTIDGKEYGRYPLGEDVTEKIEQENGAFNYLVIQDGRADMTKASCPDKICVDHRAVSKKNQSIVCLPNKVVITIENGEESDVDSSTH